MCPLRLALGPLLLLAASVAGELLQYYQPPPHHSVEESKPVYLRPVLVGKAPLDLMYLALEGKDLYLYPSAFHLLPYPLHHHHHQQVEEEKLYHHVENPHEYNTEEENHEDTDDSPTEEDRALERSATNTTEAAPTTRDRLANLTREPAGRALDPRAA